MKEYLKSYFVSLIAFSLAWFTIGLFYGYEFSSFYLLQVTLGVLMFAIIRFYPIFKNPDIFFNGLREFKENKNLRKKSFQVLFIVGAFYLFSYLSFRGSGNYVIIRSGEVRPYAFAAADKIIWNPNDTHWQTFKNAYGHYETKGNAKGYIFMPLICIERALFKPTYDFTEENAVMVKAKFSKY